MPYSVKLHVYDVSQGKAKQVSVAFCGKFLEGLFHTGICVHGGEYFYGTNGIAFIKPCSTTLGYPNEIIEYGQTELDRSEFHAYLTKLSRSSFSPEAYNIAENNCNHFTCEVLLHLTGKKAPAKIADISAEIANSPIGILLRPLFNSQTIGMQKSGCTFVGRHKTENGSTVDECESGHVEKKEGQNETSTAAVKA